MADIYREAEVNGNIIPVENGTRVRMAPTTYSSVRSTHNKGAVVEIDLVREYVESNDPNVQVGDKWGRVIRINNVAFAQPSWMAINYHGIVICTKHYTLDGEEPTNPPEAFYPDALQVSPVIGGVTYPAKTYIPE